MIRMEIACFMVLAFMATIYFVAKREKNKVHKIFSVFLIISMVHLVFDAITVKTVNNMQQVPKTVNDIFHRLFIGTMVILFYLIYRYIVAILEEDINDKIKISKLSIYILFIALLGIICLPIYYMETGEGNYSYGPAPYITYFSIAIYLCMVIYLMIKYWNKINSSKRMVITLSMSIELFVSLYQAIRPLSLVSGMGIMLINLSFYLLMENPDIRLVQQVKVEKKKAEEANVSKSIFLSHMSHEIRTPMNAIVGMTDVLLRTDIDEEQKEYLDNIKTSGHALIAIINDILDLSKIETGKMELVETEYDIKKELDNIRMIINNLIGDKPIKLLYDIDEKLPVILYGDGIRLRQVIINLLNNAVKFTDGGSIKLSVNVLSEKDDIVELKFSVKDTGIGIKNDDLKKLFEAFVQLDVKKNSGKESTGLGLAISSKIVELMGGKISVKSEYGVGSEFCFIIRQKLVDESMYPKEEAHVEFVAPNARILIVDDDAMNRKVSVKLIEHLKVQIDVADSGKTAIEMVKKKKYDVVFMDHMMPVMDGIETTRYIRNLPNEYYKNLPIIAFTANVMVDAEKLFYEVGMNGVLSKPIDTNKLEQFIYKYVPKDNIIISEKTVEESNTTDVETIEGIDVDEGIKNSGSVDLFYELMGDFHTLIDSKTNKLQKYIKEGMIRDYTIEVHALKNASRLIGAIELAEEFAKLEYYGNKMDEENINKYTDKVLELYSRYKIYLEPYGKKTSKEKNALPVSEIKNIIKTINYGVENFDLDLADKAMNELENVRLPDSCDALMVDLRIFMSDVAMEEILDLTSKMIEILEIGE
ncbi:MAG: response regulator [Lachnospiraceae bacterium]|nr:response regulator [Lachnospiraceae bacterium]